MPEWPEHCEEQGCAAIATHLFGLAGAKPTAHACCIDHMKERVAELQEWSSRTGSTPCPVLLTRLGGGESFWVEVRNREACHVRS